MTLEIFPRASHSEGGFDGGRIKEHKPIGFPGEPAPIVRVGPLFYWAWASASEPSIIEAHPHRTFEIFSYVIEGVIEHKDSLENLSRVGAGGLQFMQTGSGVWHEERFVTTPVEMFQIWLEPERRKANLTDPTYQAYDAEAFPVERHGRLLKTWILGGGSPVFLATDAQMRDVTIPQGEAYALNASSGRGIATMIVSGSGVLEDGRTVSARDFVVLKAARGPENATLTARDDLRIVELEVPLEPGYPLYHKTRAF